MLEGALRHEDSMGTGSVINVGDVQRMSAGTGVLHSERNASETEPAHFLQIWLMPERTRLPPSYEQRTFPLKDRQGRLTLVASRDSREGSIRIHQDVDLYSALLGRRRTAPVTRSSTAGTPGCRLPAATSRSTVRRCIRAMAPRSARKPCIDLRGVHRRRGPAVRSRLTGPAEPDAIRARSADLRFLQALVDCLSRLCLLTRHDPPQLLPRFALIVALERDDAVLRERDGRAEEQRQQAGKMREVSGDEEVARLAAEPIADPRRRIVRLQIG